MGDGQKKVKPFAPGEKVCKLCLQEKLSIHGSVKFFNKKMKFLDIAYTRSDSS